MSRSSTRLSWRRPAASPRLDDRHPGDRLPEQHRRSTPPFPIADNRSPKTIEMVKYAGFRWVRGGIEGLTDRGPTTLQTYLDLHRQTGVRFSWGLVSGGTDLKKLHRNRPAAGRGRRPPGLRGEQRAEQLGRHLSGRKRRRPSALVAGRREAPARSVPRRQERSRAEEVSRLVDQRGRRRSR